VRHGPAVTVARSLHLCAAPTGHPMAKILIIDPPSLASAGDATNIPTFHG
jgi:hypothetical protein